MASTFACRDLEDPLLPGTGDPGAEHGTTEGMCRDSNVLVKWVVEWWRATTDVETMQEKEGRRTRLWVLSTMCLLDVCFYMFFGDDIRFPDGKRQYAYTVLLEVLTVASCYALDKWAPLLVTDWVLASVMSLAVWINAPQAGSLTGTYMLLWVSSVVTIQALLVLFDLHSLCIVFYSVTAICAGDEITASSSFNFLFTMLVYAILYTRREYLYALQRQDRIRAQDNSLDAERRESAALFAAEVMKQKQREEEERQRMQQEREAAKVRDRELVFKGAFQAMKTPLLLAKSDLEAAHAGQTSPERIVLCLSQRIDQLWKILSGIDTQLQEEVHPQFWQQKSQQEEEEEERHQETVRGEVQEQPEPQSAMPSLPTQAAHTLTPGRPARPRSQRTKSSSSASTGSRWMDASYLEDVTFTVNVTQANFPICEMKSSFSSLVGPRLLDCVDHADASEFRDWVQGAVNALFSGLSPAECRPTSFFIPMRKTNIYIKANTVEALAVEECDEVEDSDDDNEGERDVVDTNLYLRVRLSQLAFGHGRFSSSRRLDVIEEEQQPESG